MNLETSDRELVKDQSSNYSKVWLGDSEERDVSDAAAALNNPSQQAQRMEVATLEPPEGLAVSLTGLLRPLAI